MSRGDLVSSLRAALAEHPGVSVAILFGSRARDEAGPDSDVDLAVVADATDLLALSVSLEQVVGAPVDITDLRTAPFTLVLEVLRDAVRVHERERGGYARYVSNTLLELETDLPNLRLMQRAFVARVAEQGMLGEGE